MKIPLAALKIETRDGTLAADSKVVNVLSGQKRPGLSLAVQLPVGAAQGMVVSNTLGALAIVNNSIYSVTTGLLVASIPGGVGPYDITDPLPNGLIALKDAGNIWTLVGSVVTKVPRAVTAGVVTAAGAGGIDGVYVLGIAGPGAGATGTYTIVGGVMTAIAITLGGDGYTTPPVLSFPLGGIVGATGVATINAVPTAMLPGFEYADSTYYVLTALAKIQGSALNDPTLWDALNNLALNADFGNPIAIAKQLNYVIGFSDKFTMYYYDAGNPPPGSPLSPAQNTYMDVGCASAGSVVQVGGLLAFMGKTESKGRSIYVLTGTTYQPISDQYIDKVLNQSTLVSVAAFAIRIAGNDLYVLTLRDLGVSLCFDFTAKEWSVWTSSGVALPDSIVAGSYTQGYFASNVYANSGAVDLLQHDANGKVYQMLPTLYQDDGLPIDINFVTAVLEGETSDYIRVGAVELVGDKVTSMAYVRYSDDDYQTWSAYGVVDLHAVRSQLVRQGATRRRAYQVRHTDNVPLRLRSLNLDVMK